MAALDQLPRGPATHYYAAMSAILPTAIILTEGVRGTYKKRMVVTLVGAALIGVGAMAFDAWDYRKTRGPMPDDEPAPVPDKPGYVQA